MIMSHYRNFFSCRRGLSLATLSLLALSYDTSSQLASALEQPARSKFFRYGVTNIPHEDKRHKGGEDAWYASHDMLAVADGVGGWADEGVDPGLFSKKLCRDIGRIYQQDKKQSLKDILIESVKINEETGTSTAVLLKIDPERPDSHLLTTNLGDSGYMIFRPDEEGNLEQIFKSKEQQHSFNFPYQCGTGSPLPTAAEDQEHEIQTDDIIVVGSDGLFDNLYDKHILKCLKPRLETKGSKRMEDVLKASKCLAVNAERLGHKGSYISPFSLHAREHGRNYIGGKLDDITVIVAQVQDSDGPDRPNLEDTEAARLTTAEKHVYEKSHVMRNERNEEL